MESGLETFSGDCCGAPEQGTEPPHVKRACSRQLSYSDTSPSDDCICMCSLYVKKGVKMVSHPHLGTDKVCSLKTKPLHDSLVRDQMRRQEWKKLQLLQNMFLE